MLNDPIRDELGEGDKVVVGTGDLAIGGGGSYSDDEGADSDVDVAGLSIRDELKGSKASSTASSFVAWTFALAFLDPRPLDAEDDEDDGWRVLPCFSELFTAGAESGAGPGSGLACADCEGTSGIWRSNVSEPSATRPYRRRAKSNLSRANHP